MQTFPGKLNSRYSFVLVVSRYRRSVHIKSSGYPNEKRVVEVDTYVA